MGRAVFLTHTSISSSTEAASSAARIDWTDEFVRDKGAREICVYKVGPVQ